MRFQSGVKVGADCLFIGRRGLLGGVFENAQIVILQRRAQVIGRIGKLGEDNDFSLRVLRAQLLQQLAERIQFIIESNLRLLPKPFGLNVFQQLQIRLNIRHELFALNVLHVDFEKSSFLVFLEHGGYLLGQIIVRGLIKVLHIG